MVKIRWVYGYGLQRRQPYQKDLMVFARLVMMAKLWEKAARKH